MDRSVIVSADVPSRTACRALAHAVRNVPHISGFKFGFMAGLTGLREAVRQVRAEFDTVEKEIVAIYDHQKGGTDIPEMGPKFARAIKGAGCDAAILFPLTGPETQRRWTEACQEADLRVIIGGMMTHPQFLQKEGGYICDEAPFDIFHLACDQGVSDFVVPGNKVNYVEDFRTLVTTRLGGSKFAFYAPGFISQGGDITECGKAAGSRFHAIVGRDIYDKPTEEEIRIAAEQITSKIAA